MKIDVEGLRRKTFEAIREASERKREEEKREEEKREEEARFRRLREEEASATLLIEKIPYMCGVAASEGRNSVSVMKLIYADYSDVQGLLGYKAQLVFDACKEAGLNPTVESWHDGVGVNGGYEIVVRW